MLDLFGLKLIELHAILISPRKNKPVGDQYKSGVQFSMIFPEQNRNGEQTATTHQPQTNPKAHIKQKHEEHKQTNGRKQKPEETDKHKDIQPIFHDFSSLCEPCILHGSEGRPHARSSCFALVLV